MFASRFSLLLNSKDEAQRKENARYLNGFLAAESALGGPLSAAGCSLFSKRILNDHKFTWSRDADFCLSVFYPASPSFLEGMRRKKPNSSADRNAFRDQSREHLIWGFVATHWCQRCFPGDFQPTNSRETMLRGIPPHTRKCAERILFKNKFWTDEFQNRKRIIWPTNQIIFFRLLFTIEQCATAVSMQTQWCLDMSLS